MTDRELVNPEDLAGGSTVDDAADVSGGGADGSEGVQGSGPTQQDLDTLRSVKDQEVAAAQREADTLRQRLEALESGQDLAVERLAEQTGVEPEQVKAALAQSQVQADQSAFSDAQGDHAVFQTELTWYKEMYSEAGIDPETSPEFAQAMLKHMQDPELARREYATGLIAAQTRVQEGARVSEDRERRHGRAVDERGRVDTGQYAALDESGGIPAVSAGGADREQGRVDEYLQKRPLARTKDERLKLRGQYQDILHLIVE